MDNTNFRSNSTNTNFSQTNSGNTRAGSFYNNNNKNYGNKYKNNKNPNKNNFNNYNNPNANANINNTNNTQNYINQSPTKSQNYDFNTANSFSLDYGGLPAQTKPNNRNNFNNFNNFGKQNNSNANNNTNNNNNNQNHGNKKKMKKKGNQNNQNNTNANNNNQNQYYNTFGNNITNSIHHNDTNETITERLNRSMSRDYPSSPNKSFDEKSKLPTSISLDNFQYSNISIKKSPSSSYVPFNPNNSPLKSAIIPETVESETAEAKKSTKINETTDDTISFYSTPLTHTNESTVKADAFITPTPYPQTNGESSEDSTSPISSTKNNIETGTSSSSGSSPDSKKLNDDTETESQMLVTASEGESSFELEPNIEKTITNVAIETSFANEIEGAIGNYVADIQSASIKQFIEKTIQEEDSANSDSNKSLDGSITQADHSNLSSSTASDDTESNAKDSSSEIKDIEKIISSIEFNPLLISEETAQQAETVEPKKKFIKSNLTSECLDLLTPISQSNDNKTMSDASEFDDTQQSTAQNFEKLLETSAPAQIDKTNLEYLNIEEEEITNMVQKIVTDVISQATQITFNQHDVLDKYAYLEAQEADGKQNKSLDLEIEETIISAETCNKDGDLRLNGNQIVENAIINALKCESFINAENTGKLIVEPIEFSENFIDEEAVEIAVAKKPITDDEKLKLNPDLNIIEIKSTNNGELSSTSAELIEQSLREVDNLFNKQSESMNASAMKTPTLNSPRPKKVANQKDAVVDCFSCTIV